MTTLIIVGDGEGERRCDARCYDARHPECDCVCGGRNHGRGLKAARENTTAMAKQIVRRFRGEKVAFPPEELPLFEADPPRKE